jgi:hypothetical protein
MAYGVQERWLPERARDARGARLHRLYTTFAAKRPKRTFFLPLAPLKPGVPRMPNIFRRWRMYYGDLVPLIPNTFDIPEPRQPRRWLPALMITAVIIGATLALVMAGQTPAS